jgi:hypothetical protein
MKLFILLTIFGRWCVGHAAETVLGQLPAIMGGNILVVQNPDAPINSEAVMRSIGT